MATDPMRLVVPVALALILLFAVPVRGQDNFVVGQGPAAANPNRVRVFDASGNPTVIDIMAYASGAWGVDVATGELGGAVEDEFLTAPGPGPGLAAHVKAFRRDGSAITKISFFAFAGLGYGANVAAGDTDSDGFDEIVVGVGPEAFGPQVRAWNFDGGPLSAKAGVNQYAHTTVTQGARVGTGDLDADGFDELLTAPGPGINMAPEVRGWNVDDGLATGMASLHFEAFRGPQRGALVAAGDVDDDGFDELLVGTGPDPSFASRTTGFDYDGSAPSPLTGFSTNGSAASAGDLTGGAEQEFMVGQGHLPGMDATVGAYTWDGFSLSLNVSFTAFPAPSDYGVNVAGGNLGY